MTSFLHDLPDDDYDEIQICDVEVCGQCDRCDHPCPAYFNIVHEYDNGGDGFDQDDDPLGIEYGMWANTPLGLDDDPDDDFGDYS